MILRHVQLEKSLEWTDSQHLCELTIESPIFFRDVAKSLITQDESVLSVSIDGKPLNFEKDLDIIFNPLKLDFNNKKIVTVLLKLLTKSATSEDHYLATNELKTKIIQYLDNLINTNRFDFEVAINDFTIDVLIKAMSIRIIDDVEDFVEQLTEYMSMMVELANIKLFVLVNPDSFLTSEEFIQLRNNMENRQIDILLIDNRLQKALGSIPRIIIDKDLCEI